MTSQVEFGFHQHRNHSTNPCPVTSDSNQVNITSPGWATVVTAADVTLIIVLSLIIITIFVGNIFVVLSVVLFCKMRTLSNGLIASLASADLLVAVLVLPISLQHEVVGRWTLGPQVCDFWITSDVFCCTASILNIVVIALDRYWLITKNVDYTHSAVFSRPKVCVAMLGLAWTIAALISASPLFGWRKGTEKEDPGVCMISQDYGYTIFSTFSSFWIPLFVILVVYCKIFLFARKRVIKKTKQQHQGSSRRSNPDLPPSGVIVVGPAGPRRSLPAGERSPDSLSPSESTVFQVRSRCLDRRSMSPDNLQVVEVSETLITPSHHLGASRGSPSGCCSPRRSELADESDHRLGDLVVFGGSFRLPESDDVIFGEPTSTSVNGASPSNAGSVHRRDRPRVRTTSGGVAGGVGGGGRGYEFRATLTVSVARTQRRHSQRIRRSARTLGLIIGAFLVCWCPFFVVATVAPFCNRSHVPPALQSFVLWLGYSNSLLNPAIYAIWEKSFRKSFRRLGTCDVR